MRYSWRLFLPHPPSRRHLRVLLCVNQKLYTLARQITEAYLATIPDGMLIHLETAAGVLTSVERSTKDPVMTHYERLMELYVVHVLAKLSEWDFARQIMDSNTVLSDSTKRVMSLSKQPRICESDPDPRVGVQFIHKQLIGFTLLFHTYIRHMPRSWTNCIKSH